MGTEETSRLRNGMTALANEVRERPIGYAVLALFLVIGPFVAKLLFPEAPWAAAVVGGLAFAVVAALCALPEKFM